MQYKVMKFDGAWYYQNPDGSNKGCNECAFTGGSEACAKAKVITKICVMHWTGARNTVPIPRLSPEDTFLYEGVVYGCASIDDTPKPVCSKCPFNTECSSKCVKCPTLHIFAPVVEKQSRVQQQATSVQQAPATQVIGTIDDAMKLRFKYVPGDSSCKACAFSKFHIPGESPAACAKSKILRTPQNQHLCDKSCVNGHFEVDLPEILPSYPAALAFYDALTTAQLDEYLLHKEAYLAAMPSCSEARTWINIIFGTSGPKKKNKFKPKIQPLKTISWKTQKKK